MGWINVAVNIGDMTYLAHRQGYIFTIPCTSGLKVGDTFEAEGVLLKVDALQDLHGRGEVYVLDATEVKNDKPKTRRVRPDDGGSDI